MNKSLTKTYNLTKVLAVFFLFYVYCPVSIFAQPRFSSQGHKGKVTAVFADTSSDTGAFWTAGQDGFLIRWDNGIGEHFQVTDKHIVSAVLSPAGNEIAFYETDGGVYYSVKLFDTKALKLKRSLIFDSPVLSVTYSAKGTYLIITTNTTNGIYFYTTSNGKQFKKIKNTNMLVSWAKTADSEKNVMLYSPDGTLAYYNLKNGSLLQKIQTESNLENPVLFARNYFIAGTKNNSVYIVSTSNGKKAKIVAAKSPLLFGGEDSLYYFDGSAELYSLYKISITDKGVIGPLIEKNVKSEASKIFSAGGKSGNCIFLASYDGKIYSTETEKSDLPRELNLVSSETYKNVKTISSDGESLFILTGQSVIKTSYESEIPVTLPNTHSFTMMDYVFGKLVLRTDNRRDGVYLHDLASGEERLAFIPVSRVKKIRAAVWNGQEGFLEIENDRVNFWSLAAAKLSELYTGGGIQDAVILGNTLYVGKTASTNPQSALVSVNLKTQETVAIKIEGDITYSLDADDDFIFGVALKTSGGSYTTSAFCMGSKALTVKELVNSAKEETNSFIKAKFPLAFTNVGGKEISIINVRNLKKYSLKRSASLPVAMTECGGRIALLNEDSSISWYNEEQPLPLADWYINSNGEIISF